MIYIFPLYNAIEVRKRQNKLLENCRQSERRGNLEGVYNYCKFHTHEEEHVDMQDIDTAC